MKKQIEILARLAGLVLVAIGIEHMTKMNWLLTVFYIGTGFSISIAPFFIKVK